jgi:hypothetical protein
MHRQNFNFGSHRENSFQGDEMWVFGSGSLLEEHQHALEFLDELRAFGIGGFGFSEIKVKEAVSLKRVETCSTLGSGLRI